MKISIIVPAHDDELATGRTLSNIVYQRGTNVQREVIVVPDGPIKFVRKMIRFAQKEAEKAKQNVEFRYLAMDKYHGTGNIGRDAGIQAATGDYVMFVDSGTCVMTLTFDLIALALKEQPNAPVVLWDIIQLVDPAPFAHHCIIMQGYLDKDDIGYLIPGVGGAVRTDIAKTEPWPNVGPSDWAWWCRIWKKLPKPVNAAFVHYPLTIAYAGYDMKRFREPMGPDDWKKVGYDRPFDEVANGEPLPGLSADSTAEPS